MLIANSNLVGDWANWDEFRRLEASSGLIMYGQMTAGSWIYIGSQGIVQGTYETFVAAARKQGTTTRTSRASSTVTAGLGGMGGAQPLAVTMAERRVPRGRRRRSWRIDKRLETKLPRRERIDDGRSRRIALALQAKARRRRGRGRSASCCNATELLADDPIDRVGRAGHT